MLRDQFVVCDVDQQVLLKEALDPGLRLHCRDNLQGSRGDIDIRDEDAGMEVVCGEMLGKVSHLLDTNRGIGEKLDPDGANISTGRVWVTRSRGIGVFLHHSIAGSCREGHELSPVDFVSVEAAVGPMLAHTQSSHQRL